MHLLWEVEYYKSSYLLLYSNLVTFALNVIFDFIDLVILDSIATIVFFSIKDILIIFLEKFISSSVPLPPLPASNIPLSLLQLILQRPNTFKIVNCFFLGLSYHLILCSNINTYIYHHHQILLTASIPAIAWPPAGVP